MSRQRRPSRDTVRGSFALLAALVMIAAAAAAAVLWQPRTLAAQEVTVYMSPYCGCCGDWVKHMERDGFNVAKRMVEDVSTARKQHGVPTGLASCHTAAVDGYVVEGHVPAADVRRLLTERPQALGLSAPGMPAGAPGMEGAGAEPYETVLFRTDGSADVFARHR
jgi:hypothetical protein